MLLRYTTAALLLFLSLTAGAMSPAKPDSDQDGIVDALDQCPHNTAAEIAQGVYLSGTKIGCPLDSDNDGVINVYDQCTNTAANTAVNEQGCAPKSAAERTNAADNAVVPQREQEEQTQASSSGRTRGDATLDLQPSIPASAPVHAPKSMIRGVIGYSVAPSPPPIERENYQAFDDNPLKAVPETPVSTFSIDVDTGAYSNVRRLLNAGQLPRKDAVRVEEMLNYFDYAYPHPETLDPPFRVFTQIAPTPWNAKTHLLHIGIQGYTLDTAKLPPANLVFLIDVSGSMNAPNKLPLLKASLKLLSKQLAAQDKVSIVVYAGAAGLVLEPTAGDQTAPIEAALDRLSAGGSTNGGHGIQLAYSTARQAFIQDGINRVLLATDGDFNVGTVNFAALKELVEQQRQSGIALTTLGFGSGNYNDHLMEQLADAGNGNYAYIDTLNEARKVLVEARAATLLTLAKDVKIQLEFNPVNVAEYRLIGYENRQLKREDFANDKVDAGEIGAGHTVTALYEIALLGSGGERLPALRYEARTDELRPHTNELAFLRLRYKQPDSDTSKRLEYPILRETIIDTDNTDARYRFAAAVAAFGQLLRGGQYMQDFGFEEVLQLARSARGEDAFGYRGEFLGLVSLAQSLTRTH